MPITFIRKNFKLLCTLGGIVFLFVFFIFLTANRVWLFDGTLNNEAYGDLFNSIQAARDIIAGQNPYHLMDLNTVNGREWRALYGYPLTQAWLIIPLSYLSPGLIKLAWSLLMALSLGISCWLMMRLLANTGILKLKGWGIAFSSFIILLCLEPIQNNYIYMQINIFMLLGMVLFLYWYINDHKGLAAAALALAISLKMLPVLLVIFLIIRKDWRTILLTGIWGIFFCFFPILWLGGDIFTIYSFFLHEVIAPRLGIVYSNQLFFTLPRTVGWLFPALLHNTLVIKLCNIITLLLICLLDLKGRNRENRDLYTGAIYMLGILLLMPQSQMHYLILVIPAYYLCVANCLRYNQIKYWIILALSYILFWPMLWVEDTPAHFVSLALLLCLNALFLFRQPTTVEERLT